MPTKDEERAELLAAIEDLFTRAADEPTPDTIALPDTPRGREAAAYLSALNDAHASGETLPEPPCSLRNRLFAWLAALASKDPS